jgi:hypothetical protein
MERLGRSQRLPPTRSTSLKSHPLLTSPHWSFGVRTPTTPRPRQHRHPSPLSARPCFGSQADSDKDQPWPGSFLPPLFPVSHPALQRLFMKGAKSELLGLRVQNRNSNDAKHRQSEPCERKTCSLSWGNKMFVPCILGQQGFVINTCMSPVRETDPGFQENPRIYEPRGTEPLLPAPHLARSSFLCGVSTDT